VWSRNRINSNNEADYDLLLYVANWPQRRSYAWKQLLVARAIENQCYVAAVNRVGNDGNHVQHSGDSMVIDPLGQVLFHATDTEVIQTITINKRHLTDIREQFTFLKDADYFELNVKKKFKSH
jgi:Predicted amidohydrolase